MGATEGSGRDGHPYRASARATLPPPTPLRVDDVFGVWVMRALGTAGVLFIAPFVTLLFSSWIAGGVFVALALAIVAASWFAPQWSARRFVSCTLVADALELDGAELQVEHLRWAHASGSKHHRVVTFWTDREGSAHAYRVLGAARHMDRLEELVNDVQDAVVARVLEGELTLESASARDLLAYRLLGAIRAIALGGLGVALVAFDPRWGLTCALGVGITVLALGDGLLSARARSATLDDRGVRHASGLARWSRHTFLPLPGGALLVVPRLEHRPRGLHSILEVILGLLRGAPVLVEGAEERTLAIALAAAPSRA